MINATRRKSRRKRRIKYAQWECEASNLEWSVFASLGM